MSDKNVEIKKASKRLQLKAGSGFVDEKEISKIQDKLSSSGSDKFEELAMERLKLFDQLINEKNKDDSKELLDEITRLIMQIKSDASMFGYRLLGESSAIVLSFLEKIDHMDSDVIKIIKVNGDILRLIVSEKTKGDGGAKGDALKKELDEVCQKYLLSIN